VLLWSLLGSVVPGLGYLRAGRRVLGRVVLAVTVLVVAGAVVAALVVGPVRFAESVAVNPSKLLWVAVVVAVLGVLWTVLVLTTHVAVRGPGRLGHGQGVACGLVVLALVAVGVAPAAVAVDNALVARQTLFDVFGQSGQTGRALVQKPLGAGDPAPPAPNGAPADPWAGVPRVNVLLIGADTGTGREGTRPDTLVVASIDTRTGGTVLFSLPRNLQRVPFPAGSRAAAAYPGGFQCIDPVKGVNTDCLLNGVWAMAESHPDWYPGVRNPGLVATIEAAEAVTGLEIGRYVFVDLAGFKEFVNAVGGVTVDVRERLPIGGSTENPGGTTGWIEKGRQRLDGYHALWYARSRWSTNDYDRMRRQRCVLGALAQQVDPVTLARSFPALARTAQRNIRTDIGLDELSAWVELGHRVQGASVRSLPFTDQVINTVRPDFAKVHALVRKALQAPAPTAAPPKPGTPKPGTPKPGIPKPGTTKTGTDAADVNAVC
jgi:LCP family protein required for cell wall assembly